MQTWTIKWKNTIIYNMQSTLLLSTLEYATNNNLSDLVRAFYRVSTPPEGANPRLSQVILAISQVQFDPESQVLSFLPFPRSNLTWIDPNPRFSQVFSGFPRSSQYVNGFIKNWCFLTKIDVYRQKINTNTTCYTILSLYNALTHCE